MNNRTLAREIQALVSIAAKLIRNSMDERLSAQNTGISGLQYGILQIIRQEKQTITEISRVQMLDPSTLVPAVDALERSELVRRTKDPKDRRRTPIEITDKGRELLAQIPVLDEDDVLVKGLLQMNDVRRKELLDLLRELVGHLTSEESVRGLTEIVAAEFRGEDKRR
jgi:DNA-binding MarR family transcriptional regulator